MPRASLDDLFQDVDVILGQKKKKKFFSDFLMILFFVFAIIIAINIKNYPSEEKDFNVTNINPVASGRSSTRISYVIDNLTIPEYYISIVYGDYEKPILHAQYYKKLLFKRIPFGYSYTEYTLYLPNGYRY